MDRAPLIFLVLMLSLVATSARAVDFGDIQIRAPSTIDARIDRGVWTGINTRTMTELELRGLHNMRVAGSNLAVTSGRALSASAIARVTLPLAKSMGPAALAIGLGTLLWDAALNTWMKPSPDIPDGATYDGSTVKIWSPVHGCGGSVPSGWNIVGYIQNPAFFAGNYSQCPYWAQIAPQSGSISTTNKPATDAEIEQALNEQLSDATKFLAQANHLIDALGKLAELLSQADPISSTSGPATAPTTTETTSTTGPDGTTTTTIESTPHIQYSNTTNNISITNVTVTTITYPDGRQETERKEEESDKPKEEDEDFCKLNPMSVLCRELGDLEEPELPTQDLPLDWQKEKSATGTCPAPITVTYFGESITIKWDLVCQFAEGIRPIVLLVTVLGPVHSI